MSYKGFSISFQEEGESSGFGGQAAALLEGQNRFLRSVASGADIHLMMDELIRFMESQSKKALCSVLLLTPDKKRLRFLAAPSLPPEYNSYIDGLLVGPAKGSCGTAIYRRAPVTVVNIAEDPLWEEARAFALRHGLKACASSPILDSKGEPLGTFAFYYRDTTKPDEHDLDLIAISRDLAGIAIERVEREEEREQLLERERNARLEVERQMHFRDEFLSLISHELKTPVTALQMHLQIFSMKVDKVAGANLEKNFVTNSLKQSLSLSNNILKLSSNLLFIASLREHGLSLRPQRLELGELVRRTVERYLSFEASKIEIVMPQRIEGNWDPGALEQCIVSLISFVEHHAGGRPILLECQRQGEDAVFQVSSQSLDLTFAQWERFQLVLNAPLAHRDVKGLELDALILFELGKAYGASFSVISHPEKGTVFVFNLPLHEEQLK